ncbi:DNA-formamidopyrimidine glycosylase family protein [Clavibacter zhangzhiyongii]|uniref:DNA-formamidopyrimidine glycosylase family protein n=1 Tax=Clavibacter zhangzhiyongii TaxID=2768071 RepID=UPI00195AECF9|nr:DNA-formamidopyrimidine glycosylase family protein [Clavibacter zhangzhiyongii]MBM7025961.1 Fpg/Nei family DNA glycosylase [Clavibacter zhangzhiyongii]
MPEGDSVFVLAARLRAQVGGTLIADGELRSGARAGARLGGRRITSFDTHGKHLLMRFDDATTLHTHLRMQGSWTVTAAGKRVPARIQHQVRVRLRLDDGRTLWGIDLPVVELIPTRDERAAVGHLGPDPLRDDWDPARAVARLAARPDDAIRAALLDQRPMAGLGNLWVNEVGFLRGVHPATRVADVDLPPLVDLAARSLRHSATVPGAYQIATGDPRRGRAHWVVGRAGRPCLRCGTRVIGLDDPGSTSERARRAWWCPRCQPAAADASPRASRE